MDFLDQIHGLHDQGLPFVLATVVRVEKPTSAKPGAKAIITPDGNLSGWIGGSCAEPTVKREAAKALQDGQPRLLRLCPPEKMGLGPQEGVNELQLTCMSGGTLEIYLEPYLPKPHLVVVGHQAAAQALAILGKDLGYTVTAVGEVTRERFAAADRLIDQLDFSQIAITPNMYVVVASHGNYDEPALEAILPSKAAYVALVASKKRAESVRTYLRQAGLPEEQIARLKFPAGLDIGAATPPEIALSILAEIVQLRRQGAPKVHGRSARRNGARAGTPGGCRPGVRHDGRDRDRALYGSPRRQAVLFLLGRLPAALREGAREVFASGERSNEPKNKNSPRTDGLRKRISREI